LEEEVRQDLRNLVPATFAHVKSIVVWLLLLLTNVGTLCAEIILNPFCPHNFIIIVDVNADILVGSTACGLDWSP
jgi:hypothetical protein